jgi:mRNA-capping enzyme
LPFKTPLDDKYFSQINPIDYFPPSMVLSLQKSNNYKIGLWIDLTNTTRFYEKSVVESAGIKYLKLNCKGHSECPNVEQTRLFISICQTFLSKNPQQIIAIHCTHGFNRTGFLISAYLCEVFDWSIDAAVSTFSACRPPGIYKESYLKELFSRYGDVEDAPPAPPLPAWNFEEEEESEGLDDDGNDLEAGQSNGNQSSQQPTRRRRGKEFEKKDAKFMEGVPGVVLVTDPTKRSFIQQKIQDMCNWSSSGFPGSQPVSMSVNNIILLQQKPYKVSWKADGTRYMMLIDGKDEVYFTDRDNSIFKVVDGCPTFPRRKTPHEHVNDTLLDGEMVVDVVDHVPYPRYLAYDIVKFEGIDVGGTHFDRRAFCINKEIIGPREQAKKEGRIDRTLESFSVRFKDFWDLQHTHTLFSERFQCKLGHEVDGLIFQPVPDAYKPGQALDVLKWKPHTHNSIDFRLKIVKEHHLGMLPETFACLFAGRHSMPFVKIKATKEFRENDSKIVECTWDYDRRTWKFMRVRTDKSFPNSMETACAVFETIKTPLTKEHLLHFIDNYRWSPKNGSILPPPPHQSSVSKRSIDSDVNLMPPPKRQR